MKKFLVAGVILLVVVLLAGAAGLAYAQSQLPPAQTPGYGWGMMGGFRGRGNGSGFGMMANGAYGGMHEYMINALASALNMKPEDLQSQISAGKTPYQVAQEKGLSDAQIREVMEKTHDEALKQAVAAGAITQQQADWMDQHMEQMWTNSFGPGGSGCPMLGETPTQTQ